MSLGIGAHTRSARNAAKARVSCCKRPESTPEPAPAPVPEPAPAPAPAQEPEPEPEPEPIAQL